MDAHDIVTIFSALSAVLWAAAAAVPVPVRYDPLGMFATADHPAEGPRVHPFGTTMRWQSGLNAAGAACMAIAAGAMSVGH